VPAVATVVLTRQPADNEPLRRLLETRGLRVLEAPCLEVVFVEPTVEESAALLPLDRYDAALFASRNGVAGFFAWREGRGDSRLRRRPRLVGAVGPATAAALAERGWEADVIASPATGGQLARELLSRLRKASRVLAVRGRLSRGVAASALQAAGHAVATLTVYDNREPEVPRLGDSVDAVVVASPSAAARFLAANPNAARAAFVALGPTTAAWLTEKNITAVTAKSTRVEDLADAVTQALETNANV